MESLQAKRVNRIEESCMEEARTEEARTALSSMEGHIAIIYQQLVSDKKLTADALRFSGNIIKSCWAGSKAEYLKNKRRFERPMVL